MPDVAIRTTLRRTYASTLTHVQSGLSARAENDLGIGKVLAFGPEPATTFQRIAGIVAPTAGTQIEHEGLTFAWLSPAEWLCIGPEEAVARKLGQLDHFGELLVVDRTHGCASFEVSGGGAREALASLSPLDLWSETFRVDAVGRSLLGDAEMFIARLRDRDNLPRFRIVVDQTMASYVARMLVGINLRGPKST